MMREGWKCPQCGKIMSPDVTEHSCGTLHEGLPRVPHYPTSVPHYPPQPFMPVVQEPFICASCRDGGICGCTLSGGRVTCGVGSAPAFNGGATIA
jgi:hypothetical protein